MGHFGDKQILLVTGDRSLEDGFRKIFPCVETDGQAAGLDARGPESPKMPPILHGVEIDSAQSGPAALDHVRHAIHDHQPFVLAEHVDEILRTLEDGDFLTMETHAHSLWNLARRNGAETVADHAMRIQLAARSQDPDRATAAIDTFDHALRGGLIPGSIDETSPHPCS